MTAANDSRGSTAIASECSPSTRAAQNPAGCVDRGLVRPGQGGGIPVLRKIHPGAHAGGPHRRRHGGGNVPLSDTQRELPDRGDGREQQSVPPPPRPTDGATTADYQARFLDWQADYSQRVQARVEPLLTPQQQAAYREQVESQNARRANQRARIQAQQQTAPPQAANSARN